MENSSKALLIAAAVLIVIILVAFGVKVFNSSKGVQEQGTNVGTSISKQTGEALESIKASFGVDREVSNGGTTTTTTPIEGTENFNNDVQDNSIHIYTVEDLKKFAERVNNGENFAGITVYLENDLNLKNEIWTPIGSTIVYNETTGKNSVCSFKGIFDGQNKTISNIKVEVDNYAGLFGYASNTIKNLTVKSSTIKANNSYAGAIAGVGKYIDNCNSIKNDISGSNRVGGIVGSTLAEARIAMCKNTSNIEGYGLSTGGIVGWINQKTQIQSCINEGDVTGNIERVGGIVGAASISVNITQCVNKGDIELKYNEDAYNKDSNDNTGGIVGLLAYSEEVGQVNKVSYCYNTGKVKGQKVTGGIVGCTAQFNSVIEKCYNQGKVEGKVTVGGISGSLGRKSNIFNSYNIGKIKGKNNVGGITGNTYGSAGILKNCYNIGTIEGETNVGSIIGWNSVSSQIQNCPTDENEIKNRFINTANSGENIWEIRSGINNGYPVLIGLN